jgi:Arc/MetJ-type ribon-helix-helix transcriptional regulator
MNNFLKKKTALDNTSVAVRATFSLPSTTLEEIENLRAKFAKKGYILNRSELIRAGLLALDALPERSAIKAIGELERLKAGRPKQI